MADACIKCKQLPVKGRIFLLSRLKFFGEETQWLARVLPRQVLLQCAPNIGGRGIYCQAQLSTRDRVSQQRCM
jgi:hypothetical protein